MESTTMRKVALAGGVFYLLTFAFSLPTLGLKEAIVDNPAWVLGNSSDNGVVWASLLDFLTGLAGIGTAAFFSAWIRSCGMPHSFKPSRQEIAASAATCSTLLPARRARSASIQG